MDNWKRNGDRDWNEIDKVKWNRDREWNGIEIGSGME